MKATLALVVALSLPVAMIRADDSEAKELKIGKVKVVKADDPDKIVLLVDGKEYSVTLANTLPVSRWPKELSKEQRQVHSEALEFVKKQVSGKDVFFLPADKKPKGADVLVGDILLRGGDAWKGATPAEEVGWFMSHLNMLMIQQGYSVYVPDDTVVVPGYPWPKNTQEKRRELLQAAQRVAAANKSGIWKDREFALKLVDIGAKGVPEQKEKQEKK